MKVRELIEMLNEYPSLEEVRVEVNDERSPDTWVSVGIEIVTEDGQSRPTLSLQVDDNDEYLDPSSMM